jgi:hypothetical protein
MFCVNQALETIRYLDFIRVCGSEQELCAMKLLARELSRLGLEPEYQWFEDWWVEPIDARLSIGRMTIPVEPAVPLPWQPKSFEVSASLVSLDRLPEEVQEGVIAVRQEFDPTTVNPPGVSGQLLLFDPVPEFAPYSLAAEKRAPSAYVAKNDFDKVLESLGKKATVSWKARRCRRKFCNLVAEIPGRACPHDLVILGAHVDSWPGTVGSSDDAAGCAVVLEAARYFVSHSPQRTVRFVWFTREELDQRGSRHFVKRHNLDSETVKLFVNVDGGFEQGAPGANYVLVSHEKCPSWVRGWFGRRDLEIRVAETQAADVRAFQERGIPTFWVAGPPRQRSHLPTDRPETIDREKLNLIGRLSLRAASLAASAGWEIRT